MKQVVVCFGCKEVKGFYNTYAAEVNEIIKDSETGEVKLVKPGIVRICKSCNKKAGYKQRTRKRNAK